MNFGEVVDRICLVAKRPDKRLVAQDNVNKAIAIYTLRGSFYDDHVEGQVTITSTSYAQSISIASNFPRFRRLNYLKRPGAKRVMDPIDPKNVFSKGCEQTDVYYVSGDNIVLKVADLASALDYGYYKYPTRLSGDTDEHWMLTKIPDVIYQKALADLYHDIGEPQDSLVADKKAEDMFSVVKNDFEYGVTARSR